MIHGQWKTNKKRVPKLQTESGFRLIRVFTVEHNAQRFRAFYERFGKRLAMRPDQRKFRLFIKRRRANKNALYQAQQPDTGQGDGNHHAASIASR
jgi:hypothetical protein